MSMEKKIITEPNKNTVDMKKEYIAPQLTVVSFKSERGYAMSNGTPLADFFQLFDCADEQQVQESWTEHSTWDNSGDNFF